MLCQNCRTRDATVHLKRIVNGESMELHLCAACAASLGYADIFSGFGLDAPGYFSAAGAGGDLRRIGERVLRCENCGFSFEDVAAASRPGCPACYRTFQEKLTPYLIKLHGKAVYQGKKPAHLKEAQR
ncbi:MAG: hypothetical protein IJT27_00490 [Clostridia bacterium]|nr:hypothetical protein [Clostridia bacterium]